MSGLYNLGVDLITNPKHSRWIAPLLILSEACLCALIILYVPYTEIDYSTYIAQVHQVVQGERKYPKIVGPTGPLVYPAVHVWIYTAFYYLTTTRDVLNEEILDINVPRAQVLFAGLYLVTLAVVIACYRRVNSPPWLLVPLVLSKRLHSIFLLRLFNDAWATLFFWLTIYVLQRRLWHLSPVIWTLGVGVKMTVLLAGPALGLLLVQSVEQADAVYMGFASAGIQVIAAAPFVENLRGGDFMGYFKQAFELTRTFLFKWTVNWRFIGEETFLSKEFAGGLLVLHLSILALFMHTKWVKPGASGIKEFCTKFLHEVSLAERSKMVERLTPTFVMDTMLGSMVIGLMCARSLHYQFFAYLGWATPYLIWRGTGSMVVTAVVCAAQEWAWLVFPSTDTSSMVVVGCLAMQVVSALMARPVDGLGPPEKAMQKMQERIEETKEETKSD